MSNETKNIHRRIKDTREAKGMNQAQLAQKAGVTPAAISQIEKGDRVPSTPILRRIADVLQVSLDYLTGKSDDSELKDLLQNEKIMTFYRNFKTLDVDDQNTIIKNIEFLKREAKNKK